ncbi:hypothetical protein AVEN_220776-1 [Araneus ventricosus]|uniref:Uncharacterized protein n=1 Tax=Araneus ventricosus TaxID=182803 RepID=A0A4Y2WR95_ARAVE|nr:hypothetical protein AVEN_274961-1 [Araneus ventricosus]GBO38970.1 hypothetical protein AVEN_220776-1 [Araneus ventricosus]
MVFETASAGRNNSHSEQRLYLKSIESSISPHEHPLISNKTRTVQIRELCSPKTVKQKRTASCFLTLILSATQLATRDPVISKTDPKIQHSKYRCYDRNPINK